MIITKTSTRRIALALVLPVALVGALAACGGPGVSDAAPATTPAPAASTAGPDAASGPSAGLHLISNDGHRLAFHVTPDSSPTIVLDAGGGEDSSYWDAQAHTLRRLERDLHVGPQQRLVRLGMDVAAAERRLDTDPGGARTLLDEALQQSQDALAEIRNLSRGISPPILDEQGLAAAVTALAARGTVPTTVDVEPVRLSGPARHAAYFVVAEALTNVEKHSGATRAAVEVRPVDQGWGSAVAVIVSDDGLGGASTARGHGLAGLADRLTGVDGTLAITSPSGGPTRLTAVLPQQPQD